jgi:DNA-binding XRE family transcriptional regulator
MSPSKSGDYEFKEEVLTAIRKRIGLSQGKMAELLGVPPNTLPAGKMESHSRTPILWLQFFQSLKSTASRPSISD